MSAPEKRVASSRLALLASCLNILKPLSSCSLLIVTACLSVSLMAAGHYRDAEDARPLTGEVPAVEPLAQAFRALALRFAFTRQTDRAKRSVEMVLGRLLDPKGAIRSGRLNFNTGSWWLLTARRLRDTEFIEDLAAGGSPLSQPGEALREARLDQLAEGDYRWRLRESTDLGQFEVRELTASFRRLLHGIETAPCEGSVALPNLSTALVGIAAITVLCEPSNRASHSSRALTIRMSIGPTTSSRRSMPKVVRFIEQHVMPLELSVHVLDSIGGLWFSLEARRGIFEVRLALRQGALQRLDHQQYGDLAQPDFKLRIAGTTKKGPFRVGATDVNGALQFSADDKRLSVITTFGQKPAWRLPFFMSPLITGSLNHTFQNDGIQMTWSLTTSNRALLTRETQFAVRPNWLTSWLGAPIIAGRGDIGPDVGSFIEKAVLAFASDIELITGEGGISAGRPWVSKHDH
jgi:hypothetical protein